MGLQATPAGLATYTSLPNEGKALRRQMQSFAWADAKLCVDGCKALREQMQSFAWTDAQLRVRVGLNWH